MVEKFKIDAVANEMQPLNEGGAFKTGLYASFDSAKTEMSVSKPSPAISSPGGPA
jgi:hypothetical protein